MLGNLCIFPQFNGASKQLCEEKWMIFDYTCKYSPSKRTDHTLDSLEHTLFTFFYQQSNHYEFYHYEFNVCTGQTFMKLVPRWLVSSDTNNFTFFRRGLKKHRNNSSYLPFNRGNCVLKNNDLLRLLE